VLLFASEILYSSSSFAVSDSIEDLDIFVCPGCPHSSLCVSREHLLFLRRFVPYRPADTQASQPLIPNSTLPLPLPCSLVSVGVAVSIASISSLLVCRQGPPKTFRSLTPCANFQTLLSIPFLRLTRCASRDAVAHIGRQPRQGTMRETSSLRVSRRESHGSVC
jgi:hypothetical protein